jgi:hypothetical protein
MLSKICGFRWHNSRLTGTSSIELGGPNVERPERKPCRFAIARIQQTNPAAARQLIADAGCPRVRPLRTPTLMATRQKTARLSTRSL